MYKIAVRTYKRYDMFMQMTYQMLIDNNIDAAEHLYVVVANEQEKIEYEKVLQGKPYKQIVVSALGGEKAIKAIVDKFPVGERIVFMDDDLEYFFEFTDKPDKSNFLKKSSNLHDYIVDGFKTLEMIDAEIFTFSFYKNDFYIKEKPFKEFRPYNIPGGFFGALNHPRIITDHAHLDDIHRTCKYIEECGGTVVYNWCGFETNTGGNPGGMQASGDRGTDDSRMQIMKDMCDRIYQIPYVKKYVKEPKIAHTGMYEVKLKPVTSIKKVRNFTNHRWTGYFQDEIDSDNSVSLEEIFG